MFKAIKINLEMAHAVNGINQKESNIHGHTWKFEVTFEGNNLNHDILNSFVKDKIFDVFDHTLILETTKSNERLFKRLNKIGITRVVAMEIPPTCENILQIFHNRLIPCKAANVVKVKLWEGNSSYSKIK